ncbi:RfbC dTDP-4-dehydrorhamnose 3,5-epimerase and related enzymes [Candidatus Methylopumilus universalis]
MESKKKPYEITELTLHSDVRGFLYEAFRFTSQSIPKGGQVYIYSMEPGARRGDHFHIEKSEWVICVSGRVRLLLKTEQDEKVSKELDGRKPELIFLAPRTSHALMNESKDIAIIIAYSSEEFHPDHPDTYFAKAD